MLNNNKELWNVFWNRKEKYPSANFSDAQYFHELTTAYYLNFWEKKLKILKAGSKILECGCGSARFSEFFAKKGFDCTMMDYSEIGLQCAKENFMDKGLQGNFIVGNVNQMDFPDNSFDLVYSGGLLQHFVDISLPIKEMIRVIKPKGVFAATIIPKKFSIQSIANIYNNLILFSKRLIKRDKDINSINIKRLSEIFINSYNIKDYKNELEKNGVSEIYARCMSPFPHLSITERGNKLYTKILKRLVHIWGKFDESSNPLTEILGVSYNILGRKR